MECPPGYIKIPFRCSLPALSALAPPSCPCFIFAHFHAAYFGVARWFYWPVRLTALVLHRRRPAAIYVVAETETETELDAGLAEMG